MKIFVCKDRYEDMMTCIYEAWEWGIKNGHENLKLMKEPVKQMSLFDEYVDIVNDSEKALKVTRAIISKISMEAYIDIYNVLIASDDKLDDVYRYLRLGFRVGKRVTNMLTEPMVMNISKISKRVSNEIHTFQEFVRFDLINSEVYISFIEPKNNVVYNVSLHFMDRMPSENWIIIDTIRKIAAVHKKNEKVYIAYLSEEEMEAFANSKIVKDDYSDLWKTFFSAISIEQRENYNCQRGHFPIWLRKNVTEFQKS